MNSAPPSEVTILSFCACCHQSILISVGQKLEFNDLRWDTYDASKLPQVRDARLLICLWCVRDFEKIVEAGLPFIGHALRDAKAAFMDNLREADEAFYSEEHAPGDIVAYDDARMLKHYKEALEEHLTEQAKRPGGMAFPYDFRGGRSMRG